MRKISKKTYLENCHKHAQDFFISLNPDKKAVEGVLTALFRNNKQYGEFYCPCRVVTGDKKKDKLNICPCVYHMGEIELRGKCLCDLYIKKR